MRYILISGLLVLAACGTPQERCVNRSTQETRSMQSLLSEVEGNLARGYAWESYQIPVTRWDICGYDRITRPNGTVVSRPVRCLVDDVETYQRRVAIDPASETRKRDALLERIRGAKPQMEANIAACRATYPE